MNRWEIAAESFRKSLHTHATACKLCHAGGDGCTHVSDKCRDGAMLLSEVVIADVHAEVESLKKMHGGV